MRFGFGSRKDVNHLKMVKKSLSDEAGREEAEILVIRGKSGGDAVDADAAAPAEATGTASSADVTIIDDALAEGDFEEAVIVESSLSRDEPAPQSEADLTDIVFQNEPPHLRNGAARREAPAMPEAGLADELPEEGFEEGLEETEAELIAEEPVAGAPLELAAYRAPAPAEEGPLENAGPAKTGSRRRMGERLVELGIISDDQLEHALSEKDRAPSRMLGAILVDLGYLSDDTLSGVLGQATDSTAHDPLTNLIDPEAIRLIPEDVAHANKVLAVSSSGGTVILAMSSPDAIDAVAEFRPYLPAGAKIEPRFWPEDQLDATISAVYRNEMTVPGIIDALKTGREKPGLPGEGERWSDPLVRLFNAILLDCVKDGASAIHLEPVARGVDIRYRVKGAMRTAGRLDAKYWPALLGHIHMQAEMAPTTMGQEGRLYLRHGDRRIACALAECATLHGEALVMRLTERARQPIPLKNLGLSARNLALLQKAMIRPAGLILTAGAEASGRTTTLYALLQSLALSERTAMTLEPVAQYEVPGARQAELRPDELDYAGAVHAMLAQDPDVILFEPLEDAESLEALLHAASTGRKVLSSLYGQNALGALSRIKALSNGSRALVGNVAAIVSQRLIRRLCPVCKEAKPASPDACRILGLDPEKEHEFYHPVGCPSCGGSGFRGRTVVAEILLFDDELDEMIASNAPLKDIRLYARKLGFRTMAEDGIAKALAGEICPKDLLKAVDVTQRR